MNPDLKLIITLCLSTVLFVGCGNTVEKHEDEHEKEENHNVVTLSEVSVKEIGLKAETITLKSFAGKITAPAKVITNQDNEALVGSLVQGRVHKVFANVGDYVKAGQELMLVEGLEIGEIKAEFLTAKANLDYLKANYDRQKSLFDQKVGSQKSLHEAEAEYEKALAEYNAHDKKIHSIGLSDEDVTDNSDEHTSGTLAVKAPISGVVVERNVVIGQLIEGTTNAFKIINTSSVWIDGQIYENDFNRVSRKGDVEFVASSYPEEKFKGTITYIGQMIDEQSRTITVRAQFNNSNGKLKPQMFGEMLISSGENSKVILIPAEAIVNIDNNNFVFIQKGSYTFEKRSVVTGATQDEFVEIRNGLKENDKVIVKGAFYLKSELMKDELGEDDH